MPRPEHLVLVAGTGTDVGKTWVAAHLARQLIGAGRRVAARKPVQSFEPGPDPTDADVLAAATGEAPDAICPPEHSYPVPMAPPMAGAVLGRPVPTVAELVDELRWPAAIEVGLVESVGGIRSPLAADGDTADLAEALRPDAVVLVADAGLGAVNAVRLSVGALDRWPVLVFLNRFDAASDLHRRNLAWLAEHDGFDVVNDLGVMSRRHPDWCRPP